MLCDLYESLRSSSYMTSMKAKFCLNTNRPSKIGRSVNRSFNTDQAKFVLNINLRKKIISKSPTRSFPRRRESNECRCFSSLNQYQLIRFRVCLPAKEGYRREMTTYYLMLSALSLPLLVGMLRISNATPETPASNSVRMRNKKSPIPNTIFH
jgi:hypothetical protein